MADKRPSEENNEREKDSEKQKKESHADLLKKGIAKRVTEFLATSEGKKSLEKGKENFIQQFIQSRESSDADALAAYKEMIGKKGDDELTIKDFSDIKITYEDTFESYIEGAEKEQFTAIQEKAVSHAFLDKMDKEVQSKHFQAPQRDAWKQYVLSKKNNITDRGDLNRHLKVFFSQMGSTLSEDQKKRLNKVSIEFRDVAGHMMKSGEFEKEATEKLSKKEIISANTDVEDMVKRFLRSYAKNELAPAYENYKKEVNAIADIYKVPGFQKVLEKFDLSAETLAKHDKEFAAIYNNPESSIAHKKEAQQKSIARAIAKEDKDLGELVDALFTHSFNISKISAPLQQQYVDRFQHMWSNSEGMKKLDEIFTEGGIDVGDRKELMKQIFDLSKNELKIAGKDGKTYTLQLQKKIIDREWTADTISESFAHELPIAFLISPNENLDEDYIQKTTNVTDKEFALKDAEGKELKLYPGNLVEITTKNGKKHVGYIYKDPEGNIMLSEQPGSKNRIDIKKDDVNNASARLIENTYSLKPEHIPVLISELALMRAAATASEEEQKNAIEERNADIASHVIEQAAVVEKNPTDAEIENYDWDNNENIKSMDEKKAKDLKEHVNSRLNDFSRRIKKIDKEINDQDNIIRSLNEQIKVAIAKKSLDQNAVDKMEANLAEAKAKRDTLIDEQNELSQKSDTYKDAQKKLQDRLNKKNDTSKEKTNSVVESDEKEKSFVQVWGDINGDKTVHEPQAGRTCLMVLLPDSSSTLGGGGGTWMRGDVVLYDPLTETMHIRWYGVEGPLYSKETGSLEGKETVVQGADGLGQLKRAAGKLYKFKKYNSVGQRGIDLKGGVSAADDNAPGTAFHFDKKYEGWRKHLKDDIDFPNMKHHETKKDIKYFGKKVGNKRAWYEVEHQGNNIRVKEIKIDEQKDDKGKVKGRELKVTYEKTMSPNDFMMFAMEKDLRGYTQDDVDAANGGNEDSDKKGRNYIDDMLEAVPQPAARFGTGLFGLRWGSISGVKSSWDMVKKGVKNYFDEKNKKSKSKVENAMLTSGWFKGMEKLPFIGDAFGDIRGGIESKLDNEKKKKINEYKDEVGTRKDSSSTGGSDYIKTVLTDGEALKDPLKAAGYYLYALEQGNPYFRSLKEFSGTGWWVGKILGPKYKDQYLAYIKNIENELKKNPKSPELNNDLSMGELGFMQKVFGDGRENGVQDELKKMVGNRFFTGGLGQAQYGMRYNSSKIDEMVKGEGTKPFHQLFSDSWTGWYEAYRINDVIGVLKLLSEKVGGNEEYYYQWAGSMLMPIANGQYRTDMSPSYKSIYQTIARKNNFPFAAYISEGNGQEKMQQLMNIFSEGTLNAAMEGKTSAADRTKAFKEWREKSGRGTLDRLQNPTELFKMKRKLEGELGDQDKLNQYNTLTDYINNKYNDDDRNGITEQIDGESIIYKKNIFSASSGFVKEQMLNFNNGQFKGRSEKNGPELWEALKSKLNDINNTPEDQMSPDFFAFLLKRYFAMFHWKYNSTSKRAFIGALKYPNLIPEIFQLNVRGVFDKKFGGNDLPGEVEDTLVIFEQIFRKFAPLVKKNPDMLEDVFDDPRMVDYFNDMTPESMTKTANSIKNLQNTLKERAQIADIYDEDGGFY